MGDLDRISHPVLTDAERGDSMREDGATDAEVDAAMKLRVMARMTAQARYDKAPPKYYRPVKP